MSLKLRELIRKVRQCKTAEDERSVINKESAEIRNMGKEQSDLLKSRNLAKCIFMHMLGYPTSFIQMTCVNLLASSKFTDKRIAYVALCVLMDERSEVLLLTSNTIKKDLESSNQYIVSVALNAIGEVSTPDMCRDSYSMLLRLLGNNNVFIKKKAAAALSKVIRKCPEMLEEVAEKLHHIFEDKDHGVLLTGLALINQIFRQEPSYVEKYKKYLPNMIRYLKNLSSTNYAPQYDINGVTDPFLQVRLLEVLQLFGKDNPDASEEMNDLLASISTNTEANKNTGNAVLYELVRTIIGIEPNPGLKSLGSTILGKFLGHKDNNYKYIALNTLQEVANTDLTSVQKHKTVILDCLRDNDVSIKKRSLELVYVIINQSNIQSIMKECLNFLIDADNEFKLEMTTKLSQSLDRYSPNIKWQIDTLIRLHCLAGNFVTDETIATFINTIVDTSDLHLYSVHKLFHSLKSNLGQEGLVKVGVYIIGELGHLLVSHSLSEEGETISVSEDEVVQLFQEINERKYSSSLKQFLLNSFLKLMSKFSVKAQEQLRFWIEQDTKSYYCEVQQRAAEYLIFSNLTNDEFKREITKNVPIAKTAKERDSNKVIFGEVNEGDAETRGFQAEEIKESQGSKLISFDDIFAPQEAQTVSTKQAEIPKTAATNPGSNPWQIFEDIYSQNSQQQKAQLSNNVNIFEDVPSSTQGVGLDLQDNVYQEEPEKREILKREEISIFADLNKDSNNKNVTGVFYVSNNTGEQLTNVKINFLVKKYISFKVLSTSGTVLEPHERYGIKKEVTMTNSDPEKDIVIKINYSFTINGKDNSDSFVFKDI